MSLRVCWCLYYNIYTIQTCMMLLQYEDQNINKIIKSICDYSNPNAIAVRNNYSRLILVTQLSMTQNQNNPFKLQSNCHNLSYVLRMNLIINIFIKYDVQYIVYKYAYRYTGFIYYYTTNIIYKCT